jgi:hypothetical protein
MRRFVGYILQQFVMDHADPAANVEQRSMPQPQGADCTQEQHRLFRGSAPAIHLKFGPGFCFPKCTIRHLTTIAWHVCLLSDDGQVFKSFIELKRQPIATAAVPVHNNPGISG